MTGGPLTFHLVRADYFRSCAPGADYLPAAFAADGFIHCTDGAQNLADTANRHYRDDRNMYIALVIDVSKVHAEVRYEDGARIFPHIYGPLNRDAITAVIPVLREADGSFLPPRFTPGPPKAG